MNFVIIFISWIILFRWLTFPLGFLTVTLGVLLLDLFLASNPIIYSTMGSPPFGNSEYVVSVFIDFLLNLEGDALFHHTTYDYSRAHWDGLQDHLRDVSWNDIFKPGYSAAGERVHVEIMIIFLVNIMLSLIHLNGFQLLLLLPYLIGILLSFVPTEKVFCI